jgi:hypothetical protein
MRLTSGCFIEHALWNLPNKGQHTMNYFREHHGCKVILFQNITRRHKVLCINLCINKSAELNERGLGVDVGHDQ